MKMSRDDIKNDPYLEKIYQSLMDVRDHLKIAFPYTWKSIFEFLAHPPNAVGINSPRNKYLPVCNPSNDKGPIKGVTNVTWDIDKKYQVAKNFIAEVCPHPEIFGEQTEKVPVSNVEGVRILLEFADLSNPSKKTRWYEEDDHILE